MLLKLLLVSCMFLLARNSAQRSTHLECWLLTFTKESDPVSLERLAGFLFLRLGLLILKILQCRHRHRHHKTTNPQGLALFKFFGCLTVT